MNRVQPFVPLPVDYEPANNARERNNIIEPEIRPIHQIPILPYDSSKLFRILFVCQILSSMFTSDVAFYPIQAYGCNPYANVVWNETTQNEIMIINYCQDKALCQQNERRTRKFIGCYQRCMKYKYGLQLLNEETISPSMKVNISSLYMSIPNPLCFEWDTVKLNLKDPTLMAKKFQAKKMRAQHYDDYLSRASIFNYTSFFILIIWIVFYSCHFSSQGCQIITAFLFIVSFMLFYLSIHLGYHVLKLFTCYQRVATYDEITGEFIKFVYEPFCKSSIKILTSSYIYDDGIYEFLPEMPSSWTICYYIWVIRAVIPASLIFYWLFRSYVGTDIFNSLYYPGIYVFSARLWRRIRQH